MHKTFLLLASFCSLSLLACGAQIPTTQAQATNANQSGAAVPSTATPATSDPGPETNSFTTSNSSKGAVAGHTLTPNSAASGFYAAEDGNSLLLVLSNQTDYCGAVGAGQTHANHVDFVAQLRTLDDTGANPVVRPGTFVVAADLPDEAGNAGLALFNATDANCASLLSQPSNLATAGTITLDAVSDTLVSGTFSLSFGSDSITGTFSAPACAALVAQAVSGADLTCAAAENQAEQLPL